VCFVSDSDSINQSENKGEADVFQDQGTENLKQNDSEIDGLKKEV
jgi:hypothetical protein